MSIKGDYSTALDTPKEQENVALNQFLFLYGCKFNEIKQNKSFVKI